MNSHNNNANTIALLLEQITNNKNITLSDIDQTDLLTLADQLQQEAIASIKRGDHISDAKEILIQVKKILELIPLAGHRVSGQKTVA